jgi:Flp pilus assembly protein TadD
MRRAWWAAGLALALAGCAPIVQDRVREYNKEGLLLYERGDYAGAREHFQAALSLQPEDTALLYNAGDCSDRLGDAANAERLYRECLTRAPNHADCRHALASLMVRQNRRGEAVQMVEEWRAREPKLSSPLAEDGWLWHQAGDLPRAQKRLQEALELNPHDVRALNELALVNEELNRPERALVLYERSLTVNPRQPDATRRLDTLRAQGVSRPKPE